MQPVAFYLTTRGRLTVDLRTIELTVVIICACLPAFAPLYSRKVIERIVPDSMLSLLSRLSSSPRRTERSLYRGTGNSRSRAGYQNADSDVELSGSAKQKVQNNYEAHRMDVLKPAKNDILRTRELTVDSEIRK